MRFRRWWVAGVGALALALAVPGGAGGLLGLAGA